MAGIAIATVYEGGELVIPTTCVTTSGAGGRNIVEAILSLFLRCLWQVQAAIITMATIITTISVTPAINSPSPITLTSAEGRKKLA